VVIAAVTGMAGVGTATTLATSSVAAQFELTIDGRHEPVAVSADYPFGGRHTGRFTSKPPFCASGSLVDLKIVVSGGAPVSNNRLFTCDDGTGTLTLSIFNPIAEHDPPFRSTWAILDGSGNYAGLRGTGTYRGEFLSGGPDFLSVVFRSALEGFADRDSVAPAIAISSVRATKLRRPVGAYVVRIALSLRDDVAGNAVSYTVTARSGTAELARAFGKTGGGSLSVALRVKPDATKLRSLRLEVTAADPVGNEARMARTVKLRR
jgi:hypothetical protein